MKANAWDIKVKRTPKKSTPFRVTGRLVFETVHEQAMFYYALFLLSTTKLTFLQLFGQFHNNIYSDHYVLAVKKHCRLCGDLQRKKY